MTVLEPFGARLRRAMDERGPLCVGIDPHASLLAEWGLNDDVAGLERFSRTVVEAVAGRVAVLKPQSAFYERFGSRGVAVLEKSVEEARAAGALVVMDAKRGDIGSTMTAYAESFLHKDAPLFSDALTVSPYLGYGSLKPAVDLARESGAGLFVLALTSNPEGGEVQHAVRGDGRSVGATMLAHLAAENAGEEPLGSFGAVVGATLGDLSSYDLGINGPLLAPGIGAQGHARGPAARVRRGGAQRGAERQPGCPSSRPRRGRVADGRRPLRGGDPDRGHGVLTLDTSSNQREYVLNVRPGGG